MWATGSATVGALSGRRSPGAGGSGVQRGSGAIGRMLETPGKNGRPAFDNIEKSIAAIPKVHGCKVVFGQNREIEQIFVWADIPQDLDDAARLRNIKSLVRSVVGTVALKYGYNLDYRKVKIVEYIPDEAAGEPAPTRPVETYLSGGTAPSTDTHGANGSLGRSNAPGQNGTSVPDGSAAPEHVPGLGGQENHRSFDGQDLSDARPGHSAASERLRQHAPHWKPLRQPPGLTCRAPVSGGDGSRPGGEAAGQTGLGRTGVWPGAKEEDYPGGTGDGTGFASEAAQAGGDGVEVPGPGQMVGESAHPAAPAGASHFDASRDSGAAAYGAEGNGPEEAEAPAKPVGMRVERPAPVGTAARFNLDSDEIQGLLHGMVLGPTAAGRATHFAGQKDRLPVAAAAAAAGSSLARQSRYHADGRLEPVASAHDVTSSASMAAAGEPHAHPEEDGSSAGGEDVESASGQGELVPDDRSAVPGEPPRIQLVAAYVRHQGEPVVLVELSFLGEHVTGQAPLADNVKISAFNAFRSAFEQLDLGHVRLTYLAETSPTLEQPRVVILKLALTLPSHESFELLGVAEERGELVLSVVRACLDALNRKVSQA